MLGRSTPRDAGLPASSSLSSSLSPAAAPSWPPAAPSGASAARSAQAASAMSVDRETSRAQRHPDAPQPEAEQGSVGTQVHSELIIGEGVDRKTRFGKLQIAFQLALQATLSKLSQKNLEACFPRLAKEAPEELEAVREETVDFLRKTAQEEFDIITEKRDVIRKMKEFDKIVEKGRQQTHVNEHGLPCHLWLSPEEAVYTRLISMKRAKLAELEAAVSEANKENEALADAMSEKLVERAHALALMESLRRQLDLDPPTST
ncbi:hypothetical protein DFJ73DRAFT_884028 [Zopfochytrium polystomum]|nr:hypothetical protein DFJ73DRAFT_884028 [Zopfochytrium polystomum]